MYELLITVIFPSIILLIYWDEFGNLLYRKFHDRRNIRNHVNMMNYELQIIYGLAISRES